MLLIKLSCCNVIIKDWFCFDGRRRTGNILSIVTDMAVSTFHMCSLKNYQMLYKSTDFHKNMFFSVLVFFFFR